MTEKILSFLTQYANQLPQEYIDKNKNPIYTGMGMLMHQIIGKEHFDRNGNLMIHRVRIIERFPAAGEMPRSWIADIVAVHPGMAPYAHWWEIYYRNAKRVPLPEGYVHGRNHIRVELYDENRGG